MKVKGMDGEVGLLDVLIGTERVVDLLNCMAEGKPSDMEVTQDDVRKFFALMGPPMLVAIEFYRQQAENAAIAEVLEILGTQGE